MVDLGLLWQRPESSRQRELRERAERVAALHDDPPVRRALLQAMRWQREIETGNATRAGIARREGYTRARVTQIMKPLRLGEAMKARGLAGTQGSALTIATQ